MGYLRIACFHQPSKRLEGARHIKMTAIHCQFVSHIRIHYLTVANDGLPFTSVTILDKSSCSLRNIHFYLEPITKTTTARPRSKAVSNKPEWLLIRGRITCLSIITLWRTLIVMTGNTLPSSRVPRHPSSTPAPGHSSIFRYGKPPPENQYEFIHNRMQALCATSQRIATRCHQCHSTSRLSRSLRFCPTGSKTRLSVHVSWTTT